jgi:hypothetical protein
MSFVRLTRLMLLDHAWLPGWGLYNFYIGLADKFCANLLLKSKRKVKLDSYTMQRRGRRHTRKLKQEAIFDFGRLPGMLKRTGPINVAM